MASVSPDRARQRFASFHDGEAIDERELDDALGLPAERGWPGTEYAELQRQHPGESIIGFATDYGQCRTLFRELQLEHDDLFVDLGCGHGRVLLYGALTTGARFRGIELVERRVSQARDAVERLGLEKRVDVHRANALDAELSDATVLYLFRPFSVESEQRMLERLHDEAGRRTFTVVSNRLQPSCFDSARFARREVGTLLVLRARG
jgi:SAM-dependent methyltransferase